MTWRKKNPERYVNIDHDLKVRLVEERGSKCEKCGYETYKSNFKQHQSIYSCKKMLAKMEYELYGSILIIIIVFILVYARKEKKINKKCQLYDKIVYNRLTE